MLVQTNDQMSSCIFTSFDMLARISSSSIGCAHFTAVLVRMRMPRQDFSSRTKSRHRITKIMLTTLQPFDRTNAEDGQGRIVNC